MKNFIKAILIGIIAVSLTFIGLKVTNKSRHTVYTDAKVNAIYHELVINSGQQDVPPLIILNDPVVNAWTNGQTVFVTSGLLGAIENDDELALTMAHEIAHAINHDVVHTDTATANQEAHADKMGAFIMMRAGYDICKGRNLFMVLKAHYGDSAIINDDDHPSEGYRYDQVSMPWCSSGLGAILHV